MLTIIEDKVMREPSLKELLASVGVEVRRLETRGVALYDMVTGEKIHKTPSACYDLGLEIYHERAGVKND